jgi:hypothetical protein
LVLHYFPTQVQSLTRQILSKAQIFWRISSNAGGQDSSVDILAGYVLEGPVMQFMRGEIFHAVLTDPKAHPTSCTMGTGVFSGVNRPQRGAGYPGLSVSLLMAWSCTFASLLWLCMSLVTLTLASEDLPWQPVIFYYSFVDCSWSPCVCMSTGVWISVSVAVLWVCLCPN